MNDGMFWLDRFAPPIPTQFDEALSYAQQMKILYRSVGEAMQKLEAARDEITKEAVAASLQAVQEKFAELSAEIDNRLDNQDSEISAINEQVMSMLSLVQKHMNSTMQQIMNMNTQISQMSNSVTLMQNSWVSFKSFIESRQQELEQELIDEISQAIGSTNGAKIKVTNPITGELDTLNRTLASLYIHKMLYAITAGELSMLNITVEKFAALRITGQSLNEKGALILFNWYGQNKGYELASKDIAKLNADLLNATNLISGNTDLLEQHTALIEANANKIKELEEKINAI